ncbi:MAG: signal peptidase II [Candidatus Omnitrophota bacterium]|nr:MAG: signal peptidase II [Candidatus Omnitrophota bacterium]
MDGVIILYALSIFFIELWIKNFLKNYPFLNFPLINVVFNKGIAFGLFKEYDPFLIYLIISFFFLVLYFITRANQLLFSSKMAYGFIIGGASSNLFDRLVYGYVIDYIDIKVWPIFNLADAAITTGVAILILNSFRSR